jgi:hypothetical protein
MEYTNGKVRDMRATSCKRSLSSYLNCAAKIQLRRANEHCERVVDVDSTYDYAANHLRETENGMDERQSKITAINK